MSRDVEVNHPPSFVAEHHPDVQDLKERLGTVKKSTAAILFLPFWNRMHIATTSTLGVHLRPFGCEPRHHETRPPIPVAFCGLDGNLPVIRADAAEVAGAERGRNAIQGASGGDSRVALKRCDQGMAVSEALEPGLKVFPPYFLPVVHAGETVGRLIEAFKLLSRHCYRIGPSVRLVRNAWLYPLICIVFGWIIRAGILVYFGKYQAAWQFLWATFGVGLLLVLVAWLLFKIQAVNRVVDFVLLQIPLIRETEIRLAVVLFFATFRLAYEAGGLGVVLIFDLAWQTVRNGAIRKDLLKARRKLARNGAFEDAFRQSTLLEYDIKEMINTGSLSGQLDQCLTHIVETATEKLEMTLRIFNQFSSDGRKRASHGGQEPGTLKDVSTPSLPDKGMEVYLPSLRLTVLLGVLACPIGIGFQETSSGQRPVKQADASPSDEQTRAFLWFGALGFPDAKGLKFARVATGRWYRSNNDPPRNTYVRGFLLEEHGDRVTVLTLSLMTETFQKTPISKPAHERVTCETTSLETGAANFLEILRTRPNDIGTDRPLWETPLHPRTETFVLAWACWRNGLDKLAADLFHQASKIPNGYGENWDRPPTLPLQKLVADDLAHIEMWRSIVAFEDPAISRSQLLERFERLTKNYPESKHYQQAKETVRVLRQMVKEDAEHAAKKQVKQFDKLSQKEQVAELIFQLRDQNGHQDFPATFSTPSAEGRTHPPTSL
jgi:hypothetical protein